MSMEGGVLRHGSLLVWQQPVELSGGVVCVYRGSGGAGAAACTAAGWGGVGQEGPLLFKADRRCGDGSLVGTRSCEGGICSIVWFIWVCLSSRCC
jgi:hypothetical protein